MEDEDENFSEDEWDISHDQLEALEQNALLSTQNHITQHRQSVQPIQARNFSVVKESNIGKSSHGLGDGDNGTKEDDLNVRALQVQEDSFENLVLDEDDLPFIAEQDETYMPQIHIDETTQRERWRLNRYAPQHQQIHPASRNTRRDLYRTHPQHAAQVSFRSQDLENQISQPQTSEHTVLKTVLEELKRERDILTQNLDSATSDLRTARGEIAIIREHNTKDLKTYERQINLLKKQMHDEVVKHQAAMQAKDAAHEREVTGRNFLKHELDEQLQKIQGLQRQLKERPLREKTNDINLTPRKLHANSLRDGFNDDEVMSLSPIKSPAKSGRKSKPSTPSNRKRKQTGGQEGSIQPLPLVLTGTIHEPRNEKPVLLPKSINTRPVVRKDHKAERHFHLVQRVLNFRPLPDHLTLIESLVNFKYPSDPSQSISSELLAATSRLNGPRVPSDLLQVFVDLWIRALKESYYEPIKLFLKAAVFLIEIDPNIVDASIVTSFLPVLQNTGEINATICWYLAKKPSLDNDKNKRSSFNPHVDSAACLDLLFTIACLVINDYELIILFWRTIVTDHVLLMLSSCQPIPVITLMLKLLSTSILPKTFGNICGSDDEQLKMETYIIDRVCFLLWETLKRPDDQSKPYTRNEVCKLRLDALDFLAKIAIPTKCSVESHHGTVFLINHRLAIARIVRSIYDEVDNMYNLYPSSHSFHAELVNRGVRILHHLLTAPQAESIDLPRKLEGTIVGGDKFRVVLTRLAFREGICIDKGVTEETVNKATEILEDHVTPDEALSLLEAFGRSPESAGSKTDQ